MNKTKAIFTYIPERTQEMIESVVKKAEEEAIKLQDDYDQAKSFELQGYEYPERVIQMEEGRYHPMACDRVPWSLGTRWRDLQVAKSKARTAVDIASHIKPRKACVRIDVVDCYDIKDKLKLWSYRFEKEGHWMDFVGLRTKPAWVKVVGVGQVEAEITALRALDCDLDINDKLSTMLDPANLTHTTVTSP